VADSFVPSGGSRVDDASAPTPDRITASSVTEGSADRVGLVAGTEDSTPLQFAVALDEDSYLQLDDVVVTLRQVPGVGPVLTSGIVTQVRARHEGASFGSDIFLISDGVLPARRQEIAEVSTTRVEPEIYVPPRPGEVVRRATGQERAQALYFDQMTNRVPVPLVPWSGLGGRYLASGRPACCLSGPGLPGSCLPGSCLAGRRLRWPAPRRHRGGSGPCRGDCAG
jgi:hypothetical protein